MNSQYDSSDVAMQPSTSKQNKATSSFIAAAPRKRKSTDVLIDLVSNSERNDIAVNISATISECSQKRQKFEMTAIEAALNESERNEVNDIMSQVDCFMCDEDFDELPSTPIPSQNIGFSPSDLNKTSFTSTTLGSSVANNVNLSRSDKSQIALSTTVENSDVNADSIHGAVFRNIGNIIRSKEGIQVQSINDPTTSLAVSSKSLNVPIRPPKHQIPESRFLQIFKRNERVQKAFGKVIVDGSESDEEMPE